MKTGENIFKNMFFCVYIKCLTLVLKHGKNDVEVIVLNDIKWLNEKNIEEQLEHANLAVMTLKYPLK